MLPLVPICLGVWTRNRWLRGHRNRSSWETERGKDLVCGGILRLTVDPRESAVRGGPRTVRGYNSTIKSHLCFTLIFFGLFFFFVLFFFYFSFFCLMVSTGLLCFFTCSFFSVCVSPLKNLLRWDEGSSNSDSCYFGVESCYGFVSGLHAWFLKLNSRNCFVRKWGEIWHILWVSIF